MEQRSKRSQRTFRPVNFEELIQQIRHKQFAPVYFLEGDEAFFIDEIFDALEEEVVAPAERDFNQTILYGKDTDILTIIAEARRFPMMAERVLVLVVAKTASSRRTPFEKVISQLLTKTTLL